MNKVVGDVKDHNGREFNSFKEMCKFYNIRYGLVKKRVHAGWNLEKALTMPKSYTTVRKKVKDHRGKEFESFGDMCAYYGKKEETVRCRMRKGTKLKEALLKEWNCQ